MGTRHPSRYSGFPAAFTTTTLRDNDGADEVAAIRVELDFPLDLVLTEVLAGDDGASPLPADQPLATVEGDDMFAALEAEMVSDRVAAALAQRRDEVRESVANLLAQGGRGARGGIDKAVDAATAQDLLEWLNRMYVTSRTAELDLVGAQTKVGEGQSAAMFLGLDTTDEQSAADTDHIEMGTVTVLFAMLVEYLQDALEDLPAADA